MCELVQQVDQWTLQAPESSIYWCMLHLIWPGGSKRSYFSFIFCNHKRLWPSLHKICFGDVIPFNVTGCTPDLDQHPGSYSPASFLLLPGPEVFSQLTERLSVETPNRRHGCVSRRIYTEIATRFLLLLLFLNRWPNETSHGWNSFNR